METRIHNGVTYAIEVEQDLDTPAPWMEDDGHGIVTDWTSRDKRPGELVLNTDRNSKRFYDLKGSIEIARRDSWGSENCTPDMTPKQRAAQAVKDDYEFLKGWCDGEWCYNVISVTPVDQFGEHLGEYTEYLGGVPGTGTCVEEAIEEILKRF